MVIHPYEEKMANEWDAFVQSSCSGTILHSRRFLSYHGERFEDQSLIVHDREGQMLAAFPAAVSPADNSVVISHPGISYGGVLGSELCRGNTMVQLIQVICEYYASRGFARLLYKAVPYIYHRIPAQDDLYALFRIGAKRYRCDLTATVDLQHRGRVGSRRKRGYKKAQKAGVQIVSGPEYASPLWSVLSANLEAKHGAKPVHSLDEIALLHNWFPDEIEFVAALCDQQVEAGVVLFHMPTVSHAQYIASSEKGYDVNALDMVFEHCISEAAGRRVRYFDFGISNEDEGQVLNYGLYAFKSEFGAGGVAHEFYEIELVKHDGS